MRKNSFSCYLHHFFTIKHVKIVGVIIITIIIVSRRSSATCVKAPIQCTEPEKNSKIKQVEINPEKKIFVKISLHLRVIIKKEYWEQIKVKYCTPKNSG